MCPTTFFELLLGFFQSLLNYFLFSFSQLELTTEPDVALLPVPFVVDDLNLFYPHVLKGSAGRGLQWVTLTIDRAPRNSNSGRRYSHLTAHTLEEGT
jgi:hypothetical protein